jgi:FtsH-binding integral membrane protein
MKKLLQKWSAIAAAAVCTYCAISLGKGGAYMARNIEPESSHFAIAATAIFYGLMGILLSSGLLKLGFQANRAPSILILIFSSLPVLYLMANAISLKPWDFVFGIVGLFILIVGLRRRQNGRDQHKKGKKGVTKKGSKKGVRS